MPSRLTYLQLLFFSSIMTKNEGYPAWDFDYNECIVVNNADENCTIPVVKKCCDGLCKRNFGNNSRSAQDRRTRCVDFSLNKRLFTWGTCYCVY